MCIRDRLWIGERVLGIQEAIPETGDWFSEKGYITTMMLHAPPEWPGLRFIEVHCQNMSGGNGWITDHYNHWYYINAEEEDGSLSGNFVLCEDRGQFIAAFPEAVEKLGGIFTVATWWWRRGSATARGPTTRRSIHNRGNGRWPTRPAPGACLASARPRGGFAVRVSRRPLALRC